MRYSGQKRNYRISTGRQGNSDIEQVFARKKESGARFYMERKVGEEA